MIQAGRNMETEDQLLSFAGVVRETFSRKGVSNHRGVSPKTEII